MLVIISPAKSLNFKNNSPVSQYSNALYPKRAEQLVKVLQNYTSKKLCELMNISSGLGELNYLRYQKWNSAHTPVNAKQAIFAFNGEVYSGLKACELDEQQIHFTQKHVRIVSGLYGVLLPLDLIQPYRLEFGVKLKFNKHKNLYHYWGDIINSQINHDLETMESKTLINLASKEYSKAAILKNINGKVITPVFKEYKGESCKIITVYAKKARGLMTRFIIDNKITNPEEIKLFDTDGYLYNDNLSTESEWIFTR